MNKKQMALIGPAYQRVGQELSAVSEFFWTPTDGGPPWLVGIGFQFSRDALVFWANNDRASVGLDTLPSLDSWTGGECWGDDVLTREPARPFLSQFVGTHLTNVWECSSYPDHIDAVDLGFKDLLLPVTKLFCENASLVVLSVTPVEGERTTHARRGTHGG